MAKQNVIKNNKFKNAFKIAAAALCAAAIVAIVDRKSTRLNSSHT